MLKPQSFQLRNNSNVIELVNFKIMSFSDLPNNETLTPNLALPPVIA